jgi:hypothetical protein
MEGITNNQANQLAEEALAKARIDNQIRFKNTLYLINAEIKTSAEKGYKVLDKTLPGYQVDYVEIDRLMDNLKKRGFKVKVEYEVDYPPHWNLTISWDKPNNKKVQTKTWVNLMILLIALTLIFYFIKIMAWWMR